MPSRVAFGLVVAVLAATGCGGEGGGETPAGCRAGADEVAKALASAPGPVRVEGTPLSECLGDTSDGGDLMEVGTAYVRTAALLADRASEEPEGPAAVQLGYLIGAAERGETGAQGVGYELGRRLEAEASRVPRTRAFTRGLAAGRRGG